MTKEQVPESENPNKNQELSNHKEFAIDSIEADYNPFLIKEPPQDIIVVPKKVYTAADFDNLPFSSIDQEIQSTEVLETQERLGEIIADLMLVSSQGDAKYLSNLRMLFQLAADGHTDHLQRVLVANFSVYYAHTMHSEAPADVMTSHYINSGISHQLSMIQADKEVDLIADGGTILN